MLVTDLLLAFFIALVLAGIFSAGFGHRWPGYPAVWPSAFFFFLLLFVAVWAGGIWASPYGPMIGSVAWLPFLIVGVAIALLLAAVLPRGGPAETAGATAATLSVFFWLFLVVGAIAIIVGYIV